MLRSAKSIIISRIVLLLVLAGMLGFFGFGGDKYFGKTQEVSAMPCHEVEHNYYSDATYTNQVGWKYLTCHGTYSWGIITQYDDVLDGECCGCCGYCPEFCDPWG